MGCKCLFKVVSCFLMSLPKHVEHAVNEEWFTGPGDFSRPLSLSVSSTLSLQLCQSSPGAQSSCSSEPSPLGSAPNNDSGVEMPGTGPGSLGDLTALDDPPPGADTSALAAPSTGGLQLRKHLTTMHRFEQLKREKLKSLKDSCSWAGPAPHTRNTKLPPLPANGE